MRRSAFGPVVVAVFMTVAACSASFSSAAVNPIVSPSAPTPDASATAAAPTEPPAASTSATVTASPTAIASLSPVGGTELPLAGRDGAPGLVSCGLVGLTTIEALTAGPVGAEDLDGPEYDVLRATIDRYGDDPEFAGLKRATFREFHVDDGLVEFLGDIGSPGTFPTVTAAFDGTRWSWAGMDGACLVRGEPGDAWGSVNWTLDRTFASPNPRTRTLHLLATEAECTALAPLEGRLAPAFVFLESDRVGVQLFAQTVEVGAACDDVEPTAVTVKLPEPLGDRQLIDANPTPCRGCGG
jgi:hypothetical protein